MDRLKISALFLALVLICGPFTVMATEATMISDETDTEIAQESIDTPADSDGVDIISATYVITEGSGTSLSAAGLDATASITDSDALDLDGEALLLYDIETKTMLYAKNIDEQREPASLTKVMTCLLALKYGDLEAEVTVTASALSTMDPDGSSAGLLAGEVYTLETLLYCLMVNSSNDAALVIAEYLGGSQDGFVEMMNEEAESLGCTNTHFANPHGFHEDDHYSTARDMAKIFMAALEYDTFQQLYAKEMYLIPATDLQSSRTIYSTNYLISDKITAAYCDDRVLGGKTGFTTPAGRCVICTAQVEERTCLAVVMGASSTDETGTAVYASFTTASALFDHAFDELSMTCVLEAGYVVTSLEVENGVGSATLDTPEDINVFLPEDYDTSQITLTYSLYSQELTAPLTQDTQVGIIYVTYNGVTVAQTPLVVAATVKELSEEVQQALGAKNTTSNTTTTITETQSSDAEASAGATFDIKTTMTLLVLLVLGIAGLGLVILLILIMRATLIRRKWRRARRRKRRSQNGARRSSRNGTARRTQGGQAGRRTRNTTTVNRRPRR